MSLAYQDQEIESNSKTIKLLDSDKLHQLIYQWKAKGDIWIGFSEGESTQKIKTELLDGFAFEIPPAERTVGTLQKITKAISSYLITEPIEWQAWTDNYNDDMDSDHGLRLNVVLSFCHQLQWICDVFADVPGASVTIR